MKKNNKNSSRETVEPIFNDHIKIVDDQGKTVLSQRGISMNKIMTRGKNQDD